jgi:hypothetical protein
LEARGGVQDCGCWHNRITDEQSFKFKLSSQVRRDDVKRGSEWKKYHGIEPWDASGLVINEILEVISNDYAHNETKREVIRAMMVSAAGNQR